jgi:ribosomal-protein-alanine N-acetyltransferase
MSFALKPVRQADLTRLAQLHAACFADDAWSSSALATLLAMPGVDGRFSEQNDGMPFAMVLDQCLGPDAEILTIAVAPSWRRQGVARRLLADLAIRATMHGARQLFLEVAADNVAALALYRQAGFQQLGIRRDYYRRASGIAVDAWRLCLSLPAKHS